MIFFQRRRLLFWLLRAYIRKWKKTILLFFLAGLAAFFLLYVIIRLLQPSIFRNTDSIGIIGSYTIETLPNQIQNKMSYGLTEVSDNGNPKPKAASSWSIRDNGKTYIFNIRENLFFNDGRRLTSDQINYNFEDVKVERPSKDTIVFKLRSSYSPFLITVSRPIFRGKFVGLGNYKLKDLDLNGDFIDTITLTSSTSNDSLVYKFYPTEESLKLALLLGEIDKTEDVSDLSVFEESLSKFRNLKLEKRVNYDKLVTIFYNTQNKNLSDKKLREALNYALPEQFEQGKRNYTPYPPTLWVSREQSLSSPQDIEHAKRLMKDSASSTSGKLTFDLKVLPKYKTSAQKIKEVWQNLGIKINIETVNSLPPNFDMFLGEFFVSKDPDQYVLWHSSQENNITRYKNLRIDKLLEDGRQVTDTSERRKIYSDFQKYLLDDPPASFLFFPYNYSVSR